jgi:hypothetical protein
VVVAVEMEEKEGDKIVCSTPHERVGVCARHGSPYPLLQVLARVHDVVEHLLALVALSSSTATAQHTRAAISGGRGQGRRSRDRHRHDKVRARSRGRRLARSTRQQRKSMFAAGASVCHGSHASRA